MKGTLKVLIIMAIFSLKSAFGATPEQGFWKWFQKNENEFFNFEQDQENIFNKLAARMSKVNDNLTFEFGPITDVGKREFVISAGGIKAAFPLVESLHSAAPNLEKWVFMKYRSRRVPLHDLEFSGVSVAVANVHYKMYKDDNKVGILVFIEGQNEEQADLYANIGYLFLDEALGEYDVETKVGFIEIHNRQSKHYEGASPLSELASDLDAYYQSH